MFPCPDLYIFAEDMSKKDFKILEHPADLGIEAQGKDLKEAFEQAALALMSIIIDLSTVKKQAAKTVEITGTDHEHLLVKWLSEVLYLYDGEGFAGCRFEVQQLTVDSLEAIVHGEVFDPSKHQTRLDVKAVTYHQLQIETNENRAKVRVFVDV